MIKRTKRNAPGLSNFGFSTILLAFVMICIVTISALSLLTANSDYKLSQKVAEKNTTYYLADKTANERLGDIDQILAVAYADATGASSYYKAVSLSLESLDYGTYDRTTGSFRYEVTIAEHQTLQVELLVHYPKEKTAPLFEIITWKSVYDEIEVDEGTLDLID